MKKSAIKEHAYCRAFYKEGRHPTEAAHYYWRTKSIGERNSRQAQKKKLGV